MYSTLKIDNNNITTQVDIETKQNLLNFVSQFIIPNSKCLAWIADTYLHSQKHVFNLRDEIEFDYLDLEDQDSVNSPKNLELAETQTTYIEPHVVFDQNYLGGFILVSRLCCGYSRILHRLCALYIADTIVKLYIN